MREVGVEHPVLQKTYRLEKAVADVEEIAKSKGAWVDAKKNPDALPHKGDSVLVSSPEHVLVLVSEPVPVAGRPGVFHAQVAEGGQGTKGNRTHVTSNDIRREDKALRIGQRTVQGWADGAKLLSSVGS